MKNTDYRLQQDAGFIMFETYGKQALFADHTSDSKGERRTRASAPSNGTDLNSLARRSTHVLCADPTHWPSRGLSFDPLVVRWTLLTLGAGRDYPA
jgi:hypothetical protein